MFRQGQLAVQGLAILLGRNEAGISNKGKNFLHHAVERHFWLYLITPAGVDLKMWKLLNLEENLQDCNFALWSVRTLSSAHSLAMRLSQKRARNESTRNEGQFSTVERAESEGGPCTYDVRVRTERGQQ